MHTAPESASVHRRSMVSSRPDSKLASVTAVSVPGIFRIMVPCSASPSPDSALPLRRMCRLRRSGYLPAPVAEPGDHVNASAERGDVGAHDVDAGDLAVFDLGDAGLGHAEGLC